MRPSINMPDDNNAIQKLVAAFQTGELTSVELGQRILESAVRMQGPTTPDLDRNRRCGYPEVIYGTGKSPDSIRTVADALLTTSEEILVTRVSPEQARTLTEMFTYCRWNHVGKTLRIGRRSIPLPPEDVTGIDSNEAHSADVVKSDAVKPVAIVSAGTTDEPIAIEAQETLAWMGVPTRLVQDIGVAGPYRLLSQVPMLQTMKAIVCVAGMEGALPSVLGGHVRCPVIAVPTSVGYGANFGGLSALLSMLNSCASNVAVVNIDAGFKAGYMAGLIARG
jgi:pyridinium-3,5-biscarboxylic acid mononucleotide synthase